MAPLQPATLRAQFSYEPHIDLGSNSSGKNALPVKMTTMKTSILERKINEEPLTWGTPEMIRLAKKRLKAGLPAALPASGNTDTPSKVSVEVPPSKNSPSVAPNKTAKVKSQNLVAPIETPCYPKIRAKYDLLIANVMASKSMSQRDKKARMKNIELRYENEVQEKRYQKYTLLCLAGLIVITSSILYTKLYLI